MTVTLHSFLDLFTRAIDGATHLIGRAEVFAAERGISEADMLGWRLADDMHPLPFQISVVANFSASWSARAAGLTPLEGVAWAEADLAGLKAALAASRAFIATITPEQTAGRDELPLTVQITDTMVPTLPTETWVTSFATTNIQFHLSMIYALLRANGVPLSKIDLFPKGL
jgi:uncharacterized protein